MIKIENTSVMGWEPAIRGMRNPMNSWEKSDSIFIDVDGEYHDIMGNQGPACGAGEIGSNDHDLMLRLAKAGTEHAKYRRMITVYADITAPLYWWKEFDTYKVGTVANSCSTMHKIHAKEFTLEDFSCEKLIFDEDVPDEAFDADWDRMNDKYCGYTDTDFVDYNSFPGESLKYTICFLNRARDLYLETKDKRYWWQMIQLLPTSYNQKRTVMLNYENLAAMYRERKDHKLDEWHSFCDWIKELPYSELITL